MSSAPDYVMGTQGFGSAWTKDNVSMLVEVLNAAGINHYDTALLYPMTSPGASEKLLGSIRQDNFVIDTKILYRPEALRRENMEESIRRSFENLGISKIATLYAHAPDKSVSIAEQAANFDHFYRAGYFEHLGLCNYSPAQLREWVEIATANSYVIPSVYQGQYNIFCRQYERELFPVLRQHGIRFVANSPLAGGFATGKLTFAKEAEQLRGTRFEESEGNVMGDLFRMWYDKPVFHDAVRDIATGVDGSAGKVSSLAQAAVRWLLFHSKLESTDNIAIGPSTLDQLKEYLAARAAGPLPEELARQIDWLYASLREEAAPLVEVGWWTKS